VLVSLHRNATIVRILIAFSVAIMLLAALLGYESPRFPSDAATSVRITAPTAVPQPTEESAVVQPAVAEHVLEPVVTAQPIPTVAIETPPAIPTSVPVDPSQALLADLNPLWGRDTPRTVSLLEQFVARFPDNVVAREKLYAALLATAHDLRNEGRTEPAAEVLQRARALSPERGEAPTALLNLTSEDGREAAEAP
jgi:hypothetical protein